MSGPDRRLAPGGAGRIAPVRPRGGELSELEQKLVLAPSDDESGEFAERAARASLRAQIARLEREHAAIVAAGFPHLEPPAGSPARGRAGGPALLGLAELERARDSLAGHVQALRRLAADRARHEQRARARLERMRLEPGRHRFARLPVRDLGQGGCGVWEVRPRLGLIGMLAGWWQLTLSSGCPLPGGPCPRHGPAPRR